MGMDSIGNIRTRRLNSFVLGIIATLKWVAIFISLKSLPISGPNHTHSWHTLKVSEIRLYIHYIMR